MTMMMTTIMIMMMMAVIKLMTNLDTGRGAIWGAEGRGGGEERLKESPETWWWWWRWWWGVSWWWHWCYNHSGHQKSPVTGQYRTQYMPSLSLVLSPPPHHHLQCCSRATCQDDDDDHDSHKAKMKGIGWSLELRSKYDQYEIVLYLLSWKLPGWVGPQDLMIDCKWKIMGFFLWSQLSLSNVSFVKTFTFQAKPGKRRCWRSMRLSWGLQWTSQSGYKPTPWKEKKMWLCSFKFNLKTWFSHLKFKFWTGNCVFSFILYLKTWFFFNETEKSFSLLI